MYRVGPPPPLQNEVVSIFTQRFRADGAECAVFYHEIAAHHAALLDEKEPGRPWRYFGNGSARALSPFMCGLRHGLNS